MEGWTVLGGISKLDIASSEQASMYSENKKFYKQKRHQIYKQDSYPIDQIGNKGMDFSG